MILKCKLFISSFLIIFIIGCGNYSFTGASIPEGTESFQVNLFENNSGNNVGSIFEPGLDRDFTIALQNILENQTNLEMVQSNGDLIYEGEIIEYRVSPMTATANLDAAQNRLTITINLIFSNFKKEEPNNKINPLHQSETILNWLKAKENSYKIQRTLPEASQSINLLIARAR